MFKPIKTTLQHISELLRKHNKKETLLSKNI